MNAFAKKFVRLMVLLDPEEVKALHLTPFRVRVFNYVEQIPDRTTAKIAHSMGTSVPSMGATLKALCAKGYLEQTTVTSPTGGIEHTYRITL